MIEIHRQHGTDRKLYELVGPLVMNPAVLKQNNNYPFRTSEHFVWFIAVSQKRVIGFVPVEQKKNEWVINNYYVEEGDIDTLKTLIEAVIVETKEVVRLVSVALTDDSDLFEALGFSKKKIWSRYVKMIKD